MNKKFTKLIAALALLVFMTPAMVGWGQSDYSTDYTGNVTLSTTGGSNASGCVVKISNVDYDGIKAGTSSKVGAVMITVPSDTKYLHLHVAAWNGETVSLAVTPDGYSDNISLTANSGISGNSPFTFSGDPSTSDYYKVITFEEALSEDTDLTFTATGGKRFVVWGVTAEVDGATPPTPTCATPTFSPAAGTYTETQSVTISCTTEDVTIYYTTDGTNPTTSSSIFDPTSTINVTETTTIKAMAVKDGYDNSTVASATYTIIAPISGYSIDFENDADLYTDWTFTNMTSKQSSNNVSAHGGSYYGTTGGKATASVQTKTAVATLNSLTCYVTKQSANTTSSTWYIQVSSNGTDWTDVTTKDAAAVTQGTWDEFSADLSSYSNVYVRVYYSGSTAIRNIDDLVLNTTAPAVAAPTFDPASGTEFGNEGLDVTLACTTAGASIYYTLDGSNPTNESIQYSAAIHLTATTTVKAIAYVDTDASAVSTATYTYVDPDAPGTQNNPYTVAEAIDAIDAGTGTTDVYAHGIVCTAPAQLNNGQLTYWISDDGTESTRLQVYKGKGLNNQDFTSVDDIQVGDIVTVYGNLIKYSSTYEFNSGNYLYAWERPASTEPTITLSTYEINATAEGDTNNFTVTCENMSDDLTISVWYCDATGENIATYDWIETEVYDNTTITYLINPNEGEERVAFLKVKVEDNDASEVYYSELVFITQSAPVQTFDVTFDVGEGGTFVGNADFPEYAVEKEAGTYTLPSATKTNYTLTGWNDGTTTYAAGAQYTVSADVDFTAQYAPGVMYNFAGANNFYTDSELTSHPGYGSSNKVDTIYYADGSMFVASENNGYFSAATSGYFMLGKTDATLTLPTFSGYKITQVKIHSSTQHSLSVAVSIVSGENTASAAQTWSNQDSDYVYNIVEDYQASALAVKVTNNYNSQITSITLVLEAYDPNVLSTMDAIYNKAVEVGNTPTEVQVNFGGWIVTGIDDYDRVFVTDGTKGFVIQQENHGFEVGNTLTGTVTCNLELAGSFNALITGITASDLTIGSGTPTATTIALDELSGINTGALVTYAGLTYNGSKLTDGNNVIRPTNILYDCSSSFTTNSTYNVTGVIWGFNSDLEILPRSAADIELVPASITLTAIYNVFTPVDAYHIELPGDPSGGYLDYVQYVNFQGTLEASDFHVEFCDSDGNSLPYEPDWFELDHTHVTLFEETLCLEISVYANYGTPRTAYFKVWAMNGNDMVYSDIVTVSQDYLFASVLYTRATSITDGGHYIIVGFDNNNHDNAYAMGEQKSNNRGSVIISEDGTNASVINENVYDFVISYVETVDETDYYSIYDAKNSGYLCTASGGNYLRNESELSTNSKWVITFVDDHASIVASQSSNHNIMQFNYSSNNQLFSCYSSANQKPVYLYVKSDAAPSTNNTTVEATDFGTSENPTNAGYRLIASPVDRINPKAVDGMLSGEYDLYYFNEAESQEWRNYKAANFLLESGKGYLYATENGVTLSFVGAPYAGDGEVALAYTEGKRFAGWNLIGNPFATTATLDMPFYKMNEEGNGFTAKIEDLSNTINAMEGVFVQATAVNETATFTIAGAKSAGYKSIPSLNVMVSRERGTVIDNAIFRFDDGATLGKFMLDERGTKLCVPMNGKEYAIVNAQSQGEMPVNFKAAENGSYTLSVNAKDLVMDYLHLIDNMTGADVDLLMTPSYTFSAKTTDYASRFRLVFASTGSAAENTENAETFAYFNGSEWVVNASEKAALQVIDVMGRVLSSETVSGNHTMNLNLSTGVYMLRLINGNDIKVQKIVVR